MNQYLSEDLVISFENGHSASADFAIEKRYAEGDFNILCLQSLGFLYPFPLVCRGQKYMKLPVQASTKSWQESHNLGPTFGSSPECVFSNPSTFLRYRRHKWKLPVGRGSESPKKSRNSLNYKEFDHNEGRPRERGGLIRSSGSIRLGEGNPFLPEFV